MSLPSLLLPHLQVALQLPMFPLLWPAGLHSTHQSSQFSNAQLLPDRSLLSSCDRHYDLSLWFLHFFELYFHISVQKFFIFCHIFPPRQEDITLSARQPNCLNELAANQGIAIILEMRETYCSRIVRLLLSYLSYSGILLRFFFVTKEAK